MPRRRPRTSAPPLIGVVTHELREEPAQAWAPMPGRTERDLAPARLSLRLSYTQALQEAGAIAVVLPAHGYVDDTAALLDRVDGFLMSGGPDLDPAVYGQDPHPLLGPDVDLVADEYEQALLRGAAERDLPLLGICRGLQALNVSRGGTLHQHVPGHLQTHDAFKPAHDAEVDRGSLLHWLAERDGLAVNSFHHQAADRIGDGLEVAARRPTAPSRRCGTRRLASRSASSGTPSSSRTALSRRACSAGWCMRPAAWRRSLRSSPSGRA